MVFLGYIPHLCDNNPHEIPTQQSFMSALAMLPPSILDLNADLTIIGWLSMGLLIYLAAIVYCLGVQFH